MDVSAIIGIITGVVGLVTQMVPLLKGIAGAGAVSPVITNALDLVGKIVPLIGGKDTAVIGDVIKTLQDMAPLITDQIGATYTGVKNIIASLREHPASTEEQLASLDAFDKQVDAAWDAIEGQIDPDAPGAA